jgi:hypothetical protein
MFKRCTASATDPPDQWPPATQILGYATLVWWRTKYLEVDDLVAPAAYGTWPGRAVSDSGRVGRVTACGLSVGGAGPRRRPYHLWQASAVPGRPGACGKGRPPDFRKMAGENRERNSGGSGEKWPVQRAESGRPDCHGRPRVRCKRYNLEVLGGRGPGSGPPPPYFARGARAGHSSSPAGSASMGQCDAQAMPGPGKRVT